jgi:hypothetical protein
MPVTLSDPEILQAALEGLKAQRTKLETQISAIEAALGGSRRGRPANSVKTASSAPRAKRTMSAAARKRIAEAQRERWARYRKEKQQG